MPEAATAQEIETVYLEGWKQGLKAIAIYRDNSKRSQPLSTSKKKDSDAVTDTELVAQLKKQLAAAQAEAAKPHRHRLPSERAAVTHRFDISGHEGYITVGLYPDGQPGEIFLKMAKEGSTVSGLMDSFATTVSVALQYGVPLRDLVNKFAHVRFEPSGFTGNQEIPIAKSIVDYIFRWLGSRFLTPDDKASLGLIDRSAVVDEPRVSVAGSRSPRRSSDASWRSRTLPSRTRLLRPPPKSRSLRRSRTRISPRRRPSPRSQGRGRRRKSSKVIAANGHTNGHANGNGNGHANGNGAAASPITLNLGATKVSFQTQADAPSCADCGSIMVRNGSCYKCLNCGSTSGCS